MQLSSRLFISIYKTISTKFDVFKYGKCTKRMQDEVFDINTKITLSVCFLYGTSCRIEQKC